MERQFVFELHAGVDQDLLSRLDEVFHGDNLLQTVLHAHLLIERGLAAPIKTRFARPEVVDKLNFHTKLQVYRGLFDPPASQEGMLEGFKKLRDKLAHGFGDEEAMVASCLNWEAVFRDSAVGAEGRPDARGQVGTIALILLFELGVLKGVRRTDR